MVPVGEPGDIADVGQVPSRDRRADTSQVHQRRTAGRAIALSSLVSFLIFSGSWSAGVSGPRPLASWTDRPTDTRGLEVVVGERHTAGFSPHLPRPLHATL